MLRIILTFGILFAAAAQTEATYGSKCVKKIIQPKNWAPPTSPRANSYARQVGDTLYVSGIMGIDYKTHYVVSGGVKEQAKKALENIGTILK